jgi:hypothetical protein
LFILFVYLQVNSLQFENDALRKRVAVLEKLKDRSDLEEYMKNNQVRLYSYAHLLQCMCPYEYIYFFASCTVDFPVLGFVFNQTW